MLEIDYEPSNRRLLEYRGIQVVYTEKHQDILSANVFQVRGASWLGKTALDGVDMMDFDAVAGWLAMLCPESFYEPESGQEEDFSYIVDIFVKAIDAGVLIPDEADQPPFNPVVNPLRFLVCGYVRSRDYHFVDSFVRFVDATGKDDAMRRAVRQTKSESTKWWEEVAFVVQARGPDEEFV